MGQRPATYFLARDRLIPRQFANRGDRLAFSNGILILALLSALLLLGFAGDTHQLISLYAVGVFVSFTLSQTSMVWYWLHTSSGVAVAGRAQRVGVAATGLVMVVIATTKFTRWT